MKSLFSCTNCCTLVSRCTRLKTPILLNIHPYAPLYKYSTTFLNFKFYGIYQTYLA